MTEIYIVPRIIEHSKVTSPFGIRELSYADLADGCVGVMLCFDSRQSAEDYADGSEILEATIIEQEQS